MPRFTGLGMSLAVALAWLVPSLAAEVATQPASQPGTHSVEEYVKQFDKLPADLRPRNNETVAHGAMRDAWLKEHVVAMGNDEKREPKDDYEMTVNGALNEMAPSSGFTESEANRGRFLWAHVTGGKVRIMGVERTVEAQIVIKEGGAEAAGLDAGTKVAASGRLVAAHLTSQQLIFYITPGRVVALHSVTSK